MSLRNFVRKHGKRITGTWGRINHKKDKRAAGKGIRKQGKQQIKREELDNFDLLNDGEPH